MSIAPVVERLAVKLRNKNDMHYIIRKEEKWLNKPFHYNFKESEYAFCKRLTNTDKVKCFIDICNATKIAIMISGRYYRR